MRVAQFTDGHLKNRERSARAEMHAENRGVFARVNDEGFSINAGNDCLRKPPATFRSFRIVNANLVFMKIDHQFDCSARQNSLARMDGCITQMPKSLNESAERRTRSFETLMSLLSGY